MRCLGFSSHGSFKERVEKLEEAGELLANIWMEGGIYGKIDMGVDAISNGRLETIKM